MHYTEQDNDIVRRVLYVCTERSATLTRRDVDRLTTIRATRSPTDIVGKARASRGRRSVYRAAARAPLGYRQLRLITEFSRLRSVLQRICRTLSDGKSYSEWVGPGAGVRGR